MKNISSGNNNFIKEENIKKCIQNVLNQNNYHGYSSPKGIIELRTKIASFLEKLWDYQINPSNMLITTGSQQSIYLITETLLKKKDTVLIEQPTYFGALRIFQNKNISMIGINVNETGINLKELRKVIMRKKVKLIYVVPTFNNPTGYSWSIENRIEFLKIINKYNILVIEDDPYSMINYSNQNYPSLYQLNHGKNIIYLGTFSKYISASINVGYILTDSKIINKIYKYKESYDLCTPLFFQQVVLNYLDNFDIIKEVKNKIPIYKEALLNSQEVLRKNYGTNIEFSNPKGGLFFLAHFKDKKIPIELIDKQNYFIMPKNQEYTRINICSLSKKRMK